MDDNKDKDEEIDIMSNLHQKKMQIIHKEFEKNPEGLVTQHYYNLLIDRISTNLLM